MVYGRIMNSEPEPEPEPEETPMSNVLWDTWPGDTWTQTGNGLEDTGSVHILGASATAYVDDLGALNVPVQAQQRVDVHFGAAWDPTGAVVPYLPNVDGIFYDVRVAVRADITGSGRAEVWKSTRVTDSRGFPAIVPRLGGGADFDLADGEVEQVHAISTSSAVTGTQGYAKLTVWPDADGTLKIALPYYGDAQTVPDSIVFPTSEPDPGEDEDENSDPWDVLAQQLAPKVAGYAGGKGDTEMIELAEAQLPVVVAFVHGYTRGKGFDDTDMPVRALRAVIVSAASRLVVNPEQVIQYSSGDYSETSARLLGFTIPERMTLNNYRRVSA